jgi:hypothetical protein
MNMKAEMAAELTKRAKSMHLSVSKYCVLILMDWLASGRTLKLEEGSLGLFILRQEGRRG